MMRSYIEQLKAITAEADRQREEQARAKRPPLDPRMSEHWKPLTVQIDALMRSLPPVQRDRPWSMDELVARLKGRYSARPHPMNVGQALRALGWTTRREWTHDGSGRRVWNTQSQA
jgi:hypothetical protein